jgi:DNA-binding beta-propeller fold protein YncE
MYIYTIAVVLLVYIPSSWSITNCFIGKQPQRFQCYCGIQDRKDTIVPEFGESGVTFTEWGTQRIDRLDEPIDLAFHPKFPCQLWVINKRNHSTSIFFNPGQTNHQHSEWRQDVNACHYAADQTSISFGLGIPTDPCDPHTGLCPRGHKDGTFMTTSDDGNAYDWVGDTRTGRRYERGFQGVTLWPADLESYAIRNNDVYPSNAALDPFGSHIHMVHETPYSMGSVWAGEGAKFFVWDAGKDSIYGSVTLIDFVSDHGYGGYTHSQARIQRYLGLHIKYFAGIPGHMELVGDWLFIADPGNGRVVKLHTKSGTNIGDLKDKREWREPHAEYSAVSDATFLDFVAPNTGLLVPSGLAVSGERLFVGDHATSDIVVYSLFDHDVNANGAEPSARIESMRVRTRALSLMGLAVDPTTRQIWFVDSERNSVSVVDPVCSYPANCTCDIQTAPCLSFIKNSQPVYNSWIGRNFDGCGRAYYEMCPGGDPSEYPVLRPCSFNGNCNRDTGGCDCFAGFTGVMC